MSRTQSSLIFILLAGLLCQSGCVTLSALLGKKRKAGELDTSLLRQQGYAIPPGGMPSPVADKGDGKPRVVIEIRGTGEERHLESIPLPLDRGMFVEELIQQAQLHEHFGRLNISIMRPAGSGPPIRLDLKTNDKGKATNIGKNYALLPGDHLIVFSDQRSDLAKFISNQFER